MKVLFPCTAIALMLALAGCGSGDAPNAGFEPGAKVTKFDPASDNAAKYQQASQIARTATGGWASLSPDQQALFLELNGNDKKKAETYFTSLVESEREIQANLSR